MRVSPCVYRTAICRREGKTVNAFSAFGRIAHPLRSKGWVFVSIRKIVNPSERSDEGSAFRLARLPPKLLLQPID
jgi:hypothetical protein